MVGALVAVPALAVGVVLALAVGKAASGPCLDKSQHAPCVGPGGTWISADGDARPRDAAAPATTSPSIPAFAVPTTTEPLLPEPTAKDYSVDLAVQSKQCFGSAGCNVVVEPKLNMLGREHPALGVRHHLQHLGRRIRRADRDRLRPGRRLLPRRPHRHQHQEQQGGAEGGRDLGQLPQALRTHSGRALLGWTRFGSPGIFG